MDRTDCGMGRTTGHLDVTRGGLRGTSRGLHCTGLKFVRKIVPADGMLRTRAT